MTVGAKIKELRKEAGLSLEDLAGRIGRTASNVWKIENDQLKGGPDPETVIKISDALGNTLSLIHI